MGWDPSNDSESMSILGLKGIIPPMATPFTPDEEVDEDALRREVGYFLDVGVRGLAVCGSTGEGYALTMNEVAHISEVAVDEAKGRVPVIAGVITNSTKTALQYAQKVREVGVNALMITPPHYIFVTTEQGLYEYYRDIAEQVGLPVLVYNVIPHVDVSVGVVSRLTEAKLIQGVKQSRGDIHALADMIKAVGQKIPVFSALDDMLFPSFVIGARGAVAAICTVVPELCVHLYEAVKRGDMEAGRELHYRILPIWRAVGKGNMPARLKEALALLKRPVGPARGPLTPLVPEERLEVRKALVEAGLIK